MKQALLRVMRASGVFATFRRANRHRFLIVTYHRFSRQPSARFTDAAAFAEQLQYLRNRYNLVSLSAIERHLADGHPLPSAAAVVTIDDGYHDAYDIAFPILRRYGVPATLFTATDFIDRKGWLWTDKLRYVQSKTTARRDGFDALALNESLKRDADEDKHKRIADICSAMGVNLPQQPPEDCRPATWDQIREMAAGGVDIGSHTVTHPILPNVGDQQLARELTDSRTRIEQELGRAVTSFCYPNGDYDPRVRDAVAHAGYRIAVTTEDGLNDRHNDPLTLHRVHSEHDLTGFMQSSSGFEAFKTSLRRRRSNYAS
jgi:peptidoglycan/xylan/chitin deacetylase (PgdA/CDA1 family)